MARVMDGGFRRIKRAAAPAPDVRLALVEDFVASQATGEPVPVPTEVLTTEEQVDLAALDVPVLTDVFEEDSQEAQEQPESEPTDTAAPDAPEAADETPADENEDAAPDAPAEVAQPEKDYDPIAAVLG